MNGETLAPSSVDLLNSASARVHHIQEGHAMHPGHFQRVRIQRVRQANRRNKWADHKSARRHVYFSQGHWLMERDHIRTQPQLLPPFPEGAVQQTLPCLPAAAGQRHLSPMDTAAQRAFNHGEPAVRLDADEDRCFPKVFSHRSMLARCAGRSPPKRHQIEVSLLTGKRMPSP